MMSPFIQMDRLLKVSIVPFIRAEESEWMKGDYETRDVVISLPICLNGHLNWPMQILQRGFLTSLSSDSENEECIQWTLSQIAIPKIPLIEDSSTRCLGWRISASLVHYINGPPEFAFAKLLGRSSYRILSIPLKMKNPFNEHAPTRCFEKNHVDRIVGFWRNNGFPFLLSISFSRESSSCSFIRNGKGGWQRKRGGKKESFWDSLPVVNTFLGI